MALRQVGNGFQIGFAASENGNSLDFQKAVWRGNPQIRQTDLAELFADFLWRHRKRRMDDNDPLTFLLVRHRSDNDTQLTLVQSQSLLNRFLDANKWHHLAADFCEAT